MLVAKQSVEATGPQCSLLAVAAVQEPPANVADQPEAVFTWRAIDTLTSTLAEFHSSAMRGRSVRPYAQGVTLNMLLRGVVKDLTDQGFAPPTLVGLPKN